MLKAIARPSAAGIAASLHGPILFADRDEAGWQLGKRLYRYRGHDVLVLGIPRGGVPVAAAVARALDATLDVIVSRKLASPVSEELGIGAVTADGTRFLNANLIAELAVDPRYIELATKLNVEAAAHGESRLREHAAPLEIEGRTVVIVDDGLATGATMTAAVRSVRSHHPGHIIVAAPVASRAARRLVRNEADEVICLGPSDPFLAVSIFYRDFPEVTDSEVVRLLRCARGSVETAPGTSRIVAHAG